MKIGEFSDSFLPIVDGVGRVVYSYCDSIGKTDNEVSAIVPLADMGYRGKYPFEVIDYFSIQPPHLVYDAGIPILDAHFDKQLQNKNFDIVHVHTPFFAGIEGIRYGKRHKIPIVGTFHSKYYDDFLQITGSKHLAHFGTDIIVDFYNKCDEVWAVSESSGQTLKVYGYKGEIHIMPNGMQLREIDKSYNQIVKEKFNLSDDPILLFVGQMNWKKNIKLILQACSLLKNNGYKFQLVLAGQGPHENEIKQEVINLNIDQETKLVGHITDTKVLDSLYSVADLFVFPSIYDNSPMVIREAANAGTCSIVCQDSSASEPIVNKVNGLTCQNNQQDLFEVISSYINNKEELKQLGLQAQKTIPVSWDKIINDVLERYQFLIDKNNID